MREALKPVGFIIKSAVLLAISAYPITLVIQLLSDKEPFTAYNYYIGYVFEHYWSWILVIIATLLLSRTGNKTLKYVEEIRHRHYMLEFHRWINTPYIAPLHLYYMVAPPMALSEDAKSQALDPFYKIVVSDFRDRVYINVKHKQFEPNPKPNYATIIGKSMIIQIIVNTFFLILSMAGMFYLNTITHLAADWGKALIPIAAYFFFQNTTILRAFALASPNKTYAMIKENFDEEEPEITWRDLFPDRPYGEALIFAWRADCERRQRLAYEASGKPVPVRMEYTSPGLAPKPFPSEIQPEWADEAEQNYLIQTLQRERNIVEKNQEIAGASKGKVVVFQKRK